jgi:N-carbamoyl-L-amino-acid hydrolase
MKIAEFTDPAHPYTRRAFSPLFMQAREWLAGRFRDAGLEVRVDAAGNLIGLLRAGGNRTEHPTTSTEQGGSVNTIARAGSTGVSANGSGTIMIGSHTDTVADGGRFDGIAGVIAGLEIMRALRGSGHQFRHDVELVDFLAEEPNDFGLSCVGSRGMSGFLDNNMLDYRAAGETLASAITRVGGDPRRLNEAQRADVRAFFELHIEQGPILEQKGIDVGVVTTIVGIRRLEIIFEGETDHAGTTPMDMRRDAAAAMAEAIVEVRRLAERQAKAGEGHFVATVGIAEVEPGAANVVARRARIVVDARSERKEVLERFTEAIDRESLSIASKLRVQRTAFNTLSDSQPSVCDERLRHLLSNSAAACGCSSMDLASGAGHDAAFMSRIAPMAMLFVPCRRGKSHDASEWCDAAALERGAQVVARAMVHLDQLD